MKVSTVSFGSFGQAVSEKILKNQKYKLTLAAMFVNGSKLNEQSSERTFQGCFPPSISSFGQAVSEENIF
jgi:hypothetical protein